MTWWSTMFVAAIVVVAAAVLGWGTVGFSPNRVRNIKHAEREHQVREHIVEVQRAHPEIGPPRGRMDRHHFYVIPHVCVLGYTVCVFLGAELTSNVTALGTPTRFTMAVCFLVGSALVLTGTTMGARIGRWEIKSDVRDHVTASALGDDIVLPYRLAIAGMGAMTVSSLIYTGTSFQSTTGSLGGWLTGGLAVACIMTIRVFYRAVRTFQQQDDILISSAKARVALKDLKASDDAD